MHCPKCQHENLEVARFCQACGSKLELSCPACGNLTQPAAAFCDHCGTPLTTQPLAFKTPDSRPRTPDLPRPNAERRQLTVMFCDLVGSTAFHNSSIPKNCARSCAPTKKLVPPSLPASRDTWRNTSVMGCWSTSVTRRLMRMMPSPRDFWRSVFAVTGVLVIVILVLVIGTVHRRIQRLLTRLEEL